MIEIISNLEKERLALKLHRIRSRNVALDDQLMAEVASIIREVRSRGDAALIDYTARFDGLKMRASELRVPEETLRRSALRVDSKVLEALREAIRNVRIFHEHQEESWETLRLKGRHWDRGCSDERADLCAGGTAAIRHGNMHLFPRGSGVRNILCQLPRTLG